MASPELAQLGTYVSKAAGAGLEMAKNFVPPAQFAQAAVGNILSFAGAIAPPLLMFAIAGMGLKTIITGKKPKILGG
jgi:hypothetical protein